MCLVPNGSLSPRAHPQWGHTTLVLVGKTRGTAQCGQSSNCRTTPSSIGKQEGLCWCYSVGPAEERSGERRGRKGSLEGTRGEQRGESSYGRIGLSCDMARDGEEGDGGQLWNKAKGGVVAPLRRPSLEGEEVSPEEGGEERCPGERAVFPLFRRNVLHRPVQAGVWFG